MKRVSRNISKQLRKLPFSGFTSVKDGSFFQSKVLEIDPEEGCARLDDDERWMRSHIHTLEKVLKSISRNDAVEFLCDDIVMDYRLENALTTIKQLKSLLSILPSVGVCASNSKSCVAIPFAVEPLFNQTSDAIYIYPIYDDIPTAILGCEDRILLLLNEVSVPDSYSGADVYSRNLDEYIVFMELSLNSVPKDAETTVSLISTIVSFWFDPNRLPSYEAIMDYDRRRYVSLCHLIENELELNYDVDGRLCDL